MLFHRVRKDPMTRSKIIAACLAALVAGVYLGWRLRDFVAIDACLDRGGRWNDQRDSCEGSR